MVKKLSDHVKRQHMEKDLKKFVCELCGRRFKGQSGYQFHLAGKMRYLVYMGTSIRAAVFQCKASDTNIRYRIEKRKNFRTVV
jgi:transposase-like protein